MTFLDRQAENRRRTLLLMAAFLALLGTLGLGLDIVFAGFLESGGEPFPVVSAGAISLAAGMGLLSYFGGARLVLLSLQARRLAPDDPEHVQLRNIVTEMALAAGMPLPAVYVIPDPSPNAMATGRDPAHAAIALTQGALSLFDREETQGVVAHEMAHIANRDTLTMTVAGVLLGAIAMLADWARRSVRLSRIERRRGALALLPAVMLLAVVAPLLSRILAMAVSRQREYLADATAVQFTRNPTGLARALEKIQRSVSPLRAATRGTAHLFISDPLGRRLGEHEGWLADLLSTHPPLGRRIAILKAMVHGAALDA